MIVCLEGVNGSGKTTVARNLTRAWTARGGTAAHLDPVQHTPFGRQVRAAIMAATDLDADAETLAFTSARLHAAPRMAELSQQPRSLVVVERWAAAIAAYGHVAGSAPALIEALETALTEALPIDHMFIVDTPGEEATRRLRSEPDPNRFETRGSAYLEKVRQAYLSWARDHGAVILDTVMQEHADAWADRFAHAYYVAA